MSREFEPKVILSGRVKIIEEKGRSYASIDDLIALFAPSNETAIDRLILVKELIRINGRG